MSAKETRCPTCGRRHRRTDPQNGLYWLLLHAIADRTKPGGVSYGADSWHMYFKSRFLGCRDMTLPNSKTIPIPNSTATLDVAEFSEYYGKVDAWAAEHGVWLADLEGT